MDEWPALTLFLKIPVNPITIENTKKLVDKPPMSKRKDTALLFTYLFTLFRYWFKAAFDRVHVIRIGKWPRVGPLLWSFGLVVRCRPPQLVEEA